MKPKLLLLLSFLVLLGRIFITPRIAGVPSVEGTYEALSHLLVGFLILVPFYDREEILGPSKLYGWVGWGLAIWEGIWFAVQKGFGS